MASHSFPEKPGPAGRRTHLRLIEGAGVNAAPARRARSARRSWLPATVRSRSAPDVEWGWGTGIVPTYIPVDPLDDNAHRLVKMIWGHAVADWAYCLAHDLMADITAMTGVVESTALRRWRDLRRVGLDRPRNPPSWWQHPHP